MTSEITLMPDELLAQARAASRLREFDGPPIEEPLEQLTHSLRDEACLNASGAKAWHGRLLNILLTRLRARQWFHEHPQIGQERLPPPLIILGLARTGTTLLHRLLATDERFYAAAWWECRFPVPEPDDIEGTRRIAAARAEIAEILRLRPDLAAIHPWDAMGADEDILLMDQTLLSTTAEALACVPGFRSWLHAHDLRPAYRYLIQLLQLLQWQKKQRGHRGERWVLKTPMHLGYVDVILELMPDAVFVQTHRDPLETIPSMASFAHGLWAAGSDSADPREAGRQWCETLAEHLDRCLAVRKKLPAERFIDVDFRDTVSDPLGTVEGIYREIGMAFTESTRGSVITYMNSHPREARPAHQYTLEEFGFTRSALERRFREYRERHVL